MNQSKLILAALIGALVLAGCSSEELLKDPHEGHDHAKEEEQAKNAAPPADEQPPMPHSQSGPQDALGSPQGTKTFAVVLSTDPVEPKAGPTKFILKVLHQGEAFDGATARVETSMPAMGHAGPKVELKRVSGNTYEGTTKLPMAGAYEAKVFV
ncbi:MAG TPA: FixH family protein, partial [Fimbriimonas sp.]